MRTTERSAWLLAARLPTLWAGVAPVLVGSGPAWDAGFRWDAFVAAAAAAVAIQIGVNFANDVADAARGADGADRIGPRRAVASGLISPERMRTGIAVMFGIASAAGLYLFTLRGWPVLVIGAVSMAAALGYTNGPMPYGYRGLGEMFVFLFFGLIATAGTFYAHTGGVAAEVWFAGAAMGFLATAILVANNVRDIATDAAVGKRTLAVILGRARTEQLFIACLAAAFTAVTAGVLFAGASPWTLVALLAIPMASPLVASMRRGTGSSLIPVLVGTARLQLAVAVLYAIGAVIGS